MYVYQTQSHQMEITRKKMNKCKGTFDGERVDLLTHAVT